MPRRICLTCQFAYDDPDLMFCQICGQKLEASDAVDEHMKDTLIGKTLGGRYRVVELLGYGGMSLVYRALTSPGDEAVAIKIMRRELVSDPVLVKRFMREIHLVSQLHHIHTVALLDVGQTESGLMYLVMELVEGALLDTILRDGPLGISQALDIASQVCESLDEAHAIGIVHRDLKPDNILIEKVDGRDFVKVFDFGVARMSDSNTGLTSVGRIVGTPAWMAPEQIQGDAIDCRTDIYALGVLLYKMLTGKLAFTADTPQQLVMEHLTTKPTPPSKLDPPVDISPELEELVLRMMAKNRADRPGSMASVRTSIAKILHRRTRARSGWFSTVRRVFGRT